MSIRTESSATSTPRQLMMVVGVQYRVTRSSVSGELKVGDLVKRLMNGSIHVKGAPRISAERVTSATEGMDIDIDRADLSKKYGGQMASSGARRHS